MRFRQTAWVGHPLQGDPRSPSTLYSGAEAMIEIGLDHAASEASFMIWGFSAR